MAWCAAANSFHTPEIDGGALRSQPTLAVGVGRVSLVGANLRRSALPSAFASLGISTDATTGNLVGRLRGNNPNHVHYQTPKVGGADSAKKKILCLHGFRTSGSFLKKQISKWDPSIFAHFDLDFLDGFYPAGGKSEIEGIFPPPYFEWFQFNKEFTEYTNLEPCIDQLCNYITTKGPFCGLLGFSQGATLAALILGYQAQGKILQGHPSMDLFVSVSGSKFRDPVICDVAFKDPIEVKSVHFVGEKDWLKLPSEELAAAFEDPLVIRHPQGHTVPRLDEVAVKKLSNWILHEKEKNGEEKALEAVNA